MKFSNTIPVLRSFDEGKAKEFYINFLGFEVDWEHRHEDDLPLYMQISKGDCILHLSEHHGDCSPGGQVRIQTDQLEEFQKVLAEKNYKYAKPGVQKMPWGGDMSIADPFGNRVIFTSATGT